MVIGEGAEIIVGIALEPDILHAQISKTALGAKHLMAGGAKPLQDHRHIDAAATAAETVRIDENPARQFGARLGSGDGAFEIAAPSLERGGIVVAANCGELSAMDDFTKPLGAF